MQKKHVALLSIAVVAVVGIIGGLTYALWSSTSTQTGNNVISTGCFEITFTESAGSDINLQSVFPITDSDGMNTTPYEFTIENTCDIAANYAVNFEVAQDSSLDASYLKAVLNTNTPQLLSKYTSTTATLEERSAYQLATGTLVAGAKESYAFRMWLDQDAPQDGAQSKTLSGKIVITTTPVEIKIPTLAEVCVGENAAQCISNYAITYTSEELDNTDPGKNTRFIGANPGNYVTFNGESWRVIGVFDVASSEGGATEKRVKLIRTNKIGNYAWDSSDSTINSGVGVNEWSQADIMTTLNSGAYYNRTSGTCYSGSSNATSDCDFSSIGLMSDAKSLISDAYWHTGTIDGATDTYDNSTTLTMYEGERSTNTGKTCTSGTACTDTVTRTTGWVGKVGLIYSSDYGYATSGGEAASRETCLNAAIYNWNDTALSDCKNNSWVLDGENMFTMTPATYVTHASFVFILYGNGVIDIDNAAGLNTIRPVVYLSSNVLITGGDGSSGNPFTLAV